MSKQFFTLAEIAAAKAPDLPASMSSLKRLAERGAWRDREGLCRRVAGQTKPVFEYHVSLLPPIAQARLSLIHSAPANDDTDVERDRKKVLWERFEGLSKAQKEVCGQRLAAIETAEELQRGGMSRTAAAFRACEQHGVKKSAFFDWRKRLASVDREDWLAALAPGKKGVSEFAECHADAWSALKSDYLRPERPTFSSCYRRVKKAAKAEGWSPIPSERALRRRLDAEVPKSVQTLARKGRDAAKTLYPAQRRVRKHLHAMQAVNMDGHRLDVFIAMPDGKIQRVHLIVLQDLHSGKFVGWRLAASENKVAVRLVIGDMVERHGIPDDIVLDNGRAFASKWISGGAPNRYRFKVREEEPLGLITALGINLHWTTPYAGQSKPIERAFRDLADDIAKHPFCAGAYTGNRPDAKPENYGSKAVPFEAFKAHVDRQIAEHNARPGRTASACAGRSFDETFEASLAEPSTLVKWPSPSQRALWLLAAEQIRARKGSGEIHLFGNRYWAEPLNAHAGRLVTVRFDPDNLTRELKVYDADDRLICDAPRIADTGFFDVDAAREHARKRNDLMKAVSTQKRLHAELSPEALADLYDGGPLDETPDRKPTPPKVQRLATGGLALKAPPAEITWDEQAQEDFSKGLRLIAGADIIDFEPASTASGTQPTSSAYGENNGGGHGARRDK